jgi:hypothetical protein
VKGEYSPEECEQYAIHSDLRADKHVEDAARSLKLADESRVEAATWRARAKSKKARPSERAAAPDASPSGVAAAVSGGREH